MLAEFLNQNEKILQMDQQTPPLQPQNQIVQNVQNTLVNKTSNFPIVPCVYFPQSTTT